MTIKEILKKKYRDKKLSEIESTVTDNLNKSVKHRKNFILALYYLDFTSRFKENLAYKKETFETYINDQFHLRLGTYHQERWAFIKHEKAAIKHGPGLITKIKKSCGPVNVKKVLVKINDVESKRTTPLSRNKKEEIISDYALPVKEKIVKKDKISKIEKEDQLVRLKAEVRRLKAENVELKLIIEKYKAEKKQFMEVWSPVSEFVDREEPAMVIPPA